MDQSNIVALKRTAKIRSSAVWATAGMIMTVVKITKCIYK